MGNLGNPNEVSKLSSLGATTAPIIVAVCVGKAIDGGRGRQSFGPEVLRRATGAAARALAGTAKVGLALPAETPEEVAAVSEGALLGAYAFRTYRVTSTERNRPPVEAFTLVTDAPRDKANKAAVARAHTLVDAVHLARDWVNTPPLDLPPAELATRAAAAAKAAGVAVEVLDEKALKKAGYGGILAVGMGSSRPPRLVKLTYSAGRGKPHLALVGKGITFDSGGLSLKPSTAMEWMKSDMGGAAAIIAAITAIARLGLDVNVTAWAPMAENMPSGTAQRPSDVITIYGGTTVEVMNTDAEGRLVLADGIVRASEDKPDLLIDVATLTGAQLVALGSRTSGRDGQRRRAADGDRGGGRVVRRADVADAAAGGAAHRDGVDGGRHLQHGRPVRRHAHRRAVPQGVRGRGHPVGAPGHRGSVVQRRGTARVHAQGRHRARRTHPGAAGRGPRRRRRPRRLSGGAGGDRAKIGQMG